MSVLQRKDPDGTFFPPRSNVELLYVTLFMFPGGRSCGLLTEPCAILYTLTFTHDGSYCLYCTVQFTRDVNYVE